MFIRIHVPAPISGPLLTSEQLAPRPEDTPVPPADQVTPAEYRARVAGCEACQHRIPADCAPCGWGRCGHPSITVTTQPVPLRRSSICPVSTWPAL